LLLVPLLKFVNVQTRF